MRIGAIIQARAASTRLPGKILKELPHGSGITMLQQVIRRLKKANMLDDIIVATTVNDVDDPVVKMAMKECKTFRGSEDDVLHRYHDAAMVFGLDVIVRITSDCPCIDPGIVDAVIKKHAGTGFPYTSNVGARTFARGMDVEVFSIESLCDANYNAKEPYHREHVTPYIKEHYRTQDLTAKELYGEDRFTRPDLRLTVDVLEDYTLACCIFDEMSRKASFSYVDIVSLFEKKPWLAWINAGVIQKSTR